MAIRLKKSVTRKELKTNPLFPTADSLPEAIERIEADLPITDRNQLLAHLMMFRNTILSAKDKP
jgi:hypothetical protein